MLERHQHGGHEDRQLVAVGGEHGRAEQLDGRPHHLGVLEVHRRQGRDALALDLRLKNTFGNVGHVFDVRMHIMSGMPLHWIYDKTRLEI